MSELEVDMIFFFADTAASEDFKIHGTRDDVPGCEVFADRGIALHEAFSFGVEQVAAFAAGAFCNEDLVKVSVKPFEMLE
jgi:hypothetical protein